MDSRTSLVRRFELARLDLDVLRAPIGRPGRGVDEIVQLDIATSRGAAQHFRIFPGARENRIEVLGADAPHRQLVLFVDEPRRAFEVTVSRRVAIAPGTRVLATTPKTRTIEQFTDARKRHFLCGMDEQHLFIAELPYGVSSTHAARESLRAPEVPPSLRLRGEEVIRQGEWFFLPLRVREMGGVGLAETNGRIRRNSGSEQAAGIPRAGRPHVASEVLVVPTPNAPSTPSLFVRGAIRHPDHRTVVFREFRRAVPNRERFARPVGVLWVD